MIFRTKLSIKWFFLFVFSIKFNLILAIWIVISVYRMEVIYRKEKVLPVEGSHQCVFLLFTDFFFNLCAFFILYSFKMYYSAYYFISCFYRKCIVILHTWSIIFHVEMQVNYQNFTFYFCQWKKETYTFKQKSIKNNFKTKILYKKNLNKINITYTKKIWIMLSCIF